MISARPVSGSRRITLLASLFAKSIVPSSSAMMPSALLPSHDHTTRHVSPAAMTPGISSEFGRAGGGGGAVSSAAAPPPPSRNAGGRFRHWSSTAGSPGSCQACKLSPRAKAEEGLCAAAAEAAQPSSTPSAILVLMATPRKMPSKPLVLEEGGALPFSLMRSARKKRLWPLQPPLQRIPGEGIGTKVRDHARRRLPGRPRREAVQREAMNQIRLAGPREDGHAAALFEAFAPRRDIRIRHVLVDPSFRRRAAESLAQRAPDDLVRALPPDERRGVGRRLSQRHAEDETVRLAEPAAPAFVPLDAVDVGGVAFQPEAERRLRFGFGRLRIAGVANRHLRPVQRDIEL